MSRSLAALLRAGRPLRWALLAVGVVAAFVAGALASRPSDADPTMTGPLPTGALRIDIGSTASSRPVRPGFIGFSIEYPALPNYANPLFVRLVRALNPAGEPVLRIGGQTSDWTWWPLAGRARPAGVRYTLTPRWLAAARSTASALGAHMILGINFEVDSRTLAATEARALLNGIGRSSIVAFELGNEPEAYGTLDWFVKPIGHGVHGRPASYDFGAFLRDYRNISSALPAGVPLAGPASGGQEWLSGLGQYLAANPRVRIVTFHSYPLHRCFTPRSSLTFPTIPNLLAARSASGPALGLQSAVTVAHAHGLPLRAGELNSVSCAGARGVSDTFASALWSLDTLYWMARVGVDGVNFHTFNRAVYRPFAFAHGHGRWVARVAPMYYGLLMFARAMPPGSRLLPVTASTPATLRTWASRGPDGTTRSMLINESPAHAVTVAVRPPDAPDSATAERLAAPSLRAKSGVTLAGQTFGASTVTAIPRGPLTTRTLVPNGDRYVLVIPPGSAELVSFSNSED